MTLPQAKPQPRDKTDLFVSFTLLALQGFGGVLAVVQRELVEKKEWLSPEEFVEDWAVAQTLPGPNVVNLSLMIGGRYFGLAGALSALAGILLFPTIIALSLAAAMAGFVDGAMAKNMLRGMGAVSAGLIIATGIKLAPALQSNPMGRWVCIGIAVFSFVGIGVLRLPLAWVLLGAGTLACLWAWVCLGKQRQ